MLDSEVHTEPVSTSPSLVRLVKAGDSEAWQQLVRLYAPLVYRWARQANLQDSDAADVLQDVFRAVFNSIGRFQHDRLNDTFRGWLWKITRNEIRRFHRRRISRPEAVGGSDAREFLEQVAAADLEPSSLTPDADDQEILHRALDMVSVEFEPRTWQAFWRASVSGESTAEIARNLGMSEGAVRQAKYRVLTRLRQFLGD
jgi:RNA polymerase sigma-70 factor (ECF subfamily)